MTRFQETMELVSNTVDAAGVVVILIGAAAATARFLLRLRKRGFDPLYRDYRQSLGRAILLGLEFLIAGDIIRTVAVAPTLENVATLGAIVLIRTFLSFSLQLELEGRWPWQSPRQAVEPE